MTKEYEERLERDMFSGFLHLLVLAHLSRLSPVHGYALIKAMDEATDNRGLWKEGTIYPLLNHLEKEGLVAARWGKPGKGPRRKYYEMTSAGERVLRRATADWLALRERLGSILEGTP